MSAANSMPCCQHTTIIVPKADSNCQFKTCVVYTYLFDTIITSLCRSINQYITLMAKQVFYIDILLKVSVSFVYMWRIRWGSDKEKGAYRIWRHIEIWRHKVTSNVYNYAVTHITFKAMKWSRLIVLKNNHTTIRRIIISI
jgi:hypothetical protein